MENIISFLRELKENNNREWFEQNKPRYKELQEQYNQFVQKLIDGIMLFDKSIQNITVKDCTYRIYRDVRFSHNKEPYKTHIGAYISPYGKKSGYAGYYFHLEPDNSILAVGLYMPEPKVLASVRDEIMDSGDQILKSIEMTTGFTLDQTNKLQRAPKGYPQDSKYIEYLKLKDFTLCKSITSYDNLLENVLADFKSAYAFNAILNKAVRYAKDEM
ncbi:MAG: DUF2461 domain-containing protein [Rikenellaceae bacterium]